MKIAFYISSLSGGGAEKVLVSLANYFADAGNDVSVISLEKREQFYTLNNTVRVYKNKSNGTFFKAFLKELFFIKACGKTINPDVSISFLSRTNFLVLLTNLFNKNKIVVCDRNNPLREHSKLVFAISNLLYLRANRIVVQTQQIKEFYFRYLQKKIIVQENPLDVKRLYQQIENKEMDKEDTVISIGRLEPQKDFVTLIKAFDQIANLYPSWNLKIFGVGNMQMELQNLINICSAKERIFLCGRTEIPFYELSKAKVFVLSSNYEGFPNVLCEAMEAGLICISSDCISGPRELIRDGENGYLFDVGNVEQLVELLDKTMEFQDEKLSINAQNSVKKLHIDENIKGWNSIIDTTINQ